MTIISFNFPPLSSDWAHCNLIGRPTSEQFMGRLYVENEKEKEAEFEAGKKSRRERTALDHY